MWFAVLSSIARWGCFAIRRFAVSPPSLRAARAAGAVIRRGRVADLYLPGLVTLRTAPRAPRRPHEDGDAMRQSSGLPAARFSASVRSERSSAPSVTRRVHVPQLPMPPQLRSLFMPWYSSTFSPRATSRRTLAFVTSVTMGSLPSAGRGREAHHRRADGGDVAGATTSRSSAGGEEGGAGSEKADGGHDRRPRGYRVGRRSLASAPAREEVATGARSWLPDERISGRRDCSARRAKFLKQKHSGVRFCPSGLRARRHVRSSVRMGARARVVHVSAWALVAAFAATMVHSASASRVMPTEHSAFAEWALPRRRLHRLHRDRRVCGRIRRRHPEGFRRFRVVSIHGGATLVVRRRATAGLSLVGRGRRVRA